MEPKPFRYRRRIEFRDTDAGGIVHFSVYFTLMEQAEHALWRSLGRSVVAGDHESAISWPRVAARCDYAAPLRFEDEVDVEVSVRRRGGKSVTFAFSLKCNEQPIAQGEITAVCCRFRQDAPPEPIPIPPEVAAQLDSLVIAEAAP